MIDTLIGAGAITALVALALSPIIYSIYEDWEERK